MTAERWARLRDLFEAVLERPPAKQHEYLAVLCSGDPELQREVEGLLANHLHAGNFLCGSALDSAGPALGAGQVLADRFEIGALLGSGGMGEVYEAQDRVLGSRVALKTLRVGAAELASGHARMLEEIRQARKVTHPDVCRVFDVYQETSSGRAILFFTMELLEGETLSARIKREGAFSPGEARELAVRIAGALDAAHRAGVVHRDFKSANVMLVPESGSQRPVVMDFGLARPAQPDPVASPITETGRLIGTPLYMAPEQLRGFDATAASDIYSFGVVLYELVTGQRPWQEKGGCMAGHSFRPPSQVVAGLPPEWDEAIGRCLEDDPTRRPSSASAAVSALSARRRLAVGIRMPVLVTLGAALLLALFFVVSRLSWWKGPLPSGAVIMLADIHNSTGDSNLHGLAIVLRSQIAQSGHFSLWDDSRRAEVLRQMVKAPTEPLNGQTAREAALREGVPFVLFGGIAAVSDGFVLSLRLEEVAPRSVFTRRAWDRSFPSPSRTGLLDAIHEASNWLRREVGETAGELAARDRLPQDTTTRSWEALTLYARAEQAKTENRVEEAVALLRQAVERDSHFALGLMRLGDVLLSVGRRQEGLHYWQLAQNETNRQRLTRREELRIRGLYASEVQDYSAAEAAFTEMEAEYPRDFFASFYLGHCLRWLGRLPEAAEKFEAAERKTPGSVAALSNLASVLLLAGRFSELEATIVRIEGRGASDLGAIHRGLLAFARGDYESAVNEERSAMGSKNLDRRSRAYGTLGAILAELGRDREAYDVLSGAVRWENQAGRKAAAADKILSLAWLDWKVGDRRRMHSRCMEAMDLESSPRILLGCGVLFARGGYLPELTRISAALSRYPKSHMVDAALARLEGEGKWAGGRLMEAVAAFRRASASEPPLALREYLGYALLDAGAVEQSLPILARLADQPALLWGAIDSGYPGMLTDSLPQLAHAARRSGDPTRYRTAVELYAKRRSMADPKVPRQIYK